MSTDRKPQSAVRRATSPAWRLAFVAIACIPLAITAGCDSKASGQEVPFKGPTVSVAPAVQRSVNDGEEFSGRLEAPDFVELRPRIAGTIEKVHFADGASAHEGDLLFTIDPRPYEAEVARAQSALASAKAKFDLAESELTRSKTLLDSQAASKQEFDEMNASARTSQAEVAGAEAALRVAKLNLEYTQVRAPITGRLSRANITVGNLVNAQSVLTTLTSQAKVYAYFDASEQSYLRLRAETASGMTPRVRLGLANEVGYPHDGQLDFVDNRLNDQTGAIRLRATFDNAKSQFTPGLAARLRLESPVVYNAVMVPERAIGTDQTKKFVYVVAGDGKPQFREVTPGVLFGGMRVLQSGVKPGENVIIDGLQRVIPGVPVTPELLKIDAQGMPVEPNLATKS